MWGRIIINRFLGRTVSIITILFVCQLALFLPRCHAASGLVRVAVDPNCPPYQFIREGQSAGVHVDILDSIAADCDFPLVYIPMKNMTECMTALQSGAVDIVLGIIRHGDMAKYHAVSTEPIEQSSLCMVAKKDDAEYVLTSTSRVIITYQSGVVDTSFMRTMLNWQMIPTSSQVSCFENLMEGRAHVFVGIKESILYQLRQKGLESGYEIIGDFLLPVEFSFAVQEKNTELLKKLNTAIYRLRISGMYEKIHGKWIPSAEGKYRAVFRKIALLASIAAAAVLLVALFNFRINRLLKRQVEEKTRDLRSVNSQLHQQVIETRNSNEVRNCIVESSPTAILVFGTDMRISLFNSSASRMVDEPPIVLGQSILEIPWLADFFLDRMDSLFTPEGEFRNEEISRETERGGKIFYRIGMYLLFCQEPSGKVVRGAILAIENITNERRLKDQIFEREKNLVLNRMIASIAHEIRNPLMSIKTYVELMPSKLGNPEFQQQLVHYVPKEVDRMNALVSDLIDYAKSPTTVRQTIDISEAIESCVALVLPMLKKLDIAISLNLEEGVKVRSDRSRLKQVIMNLLINGIEALEEKRSGQSGNDRRGMSIASRSDGEYCYVEIVDEGIGMTPEEMRHAMEPFYTTKPAGTGLGLAISKQYMDESGGSLWIDSEKGVSTRVTMQFKRILAC
jgi:polar amino acid transport system substrate-binding protein